MPDHAAEVARCEATLLVLDHVGLDVAEGRLRLVLDAVIECLNDIFLEMRRPWMRVHHGLALGVAVLMVGEAEHIHLHAGGHQRHHRVHVLRNAGRGVQRDGGPHRIDIGLRDVAAPEEIARGIGAVDLEAFVRAAVLVGEAHVMEHRPGVEQFRVEAQAAMFAGKRTEIIHPAGVVEQERRGGIAHQFGDLPGELAVGDGDPVDRRQCGGHGRYPVCLGRSPQRAAGGLCLQLT